MDLRIGRIGELIGHIGVSGLGEYFLSVLDGPFHPFLSWCEDQFRAQVLEELPSLHAHGFGHGQDKSIFLGCTDKGESNTRIPAGGFNDQGIFANEALSFRRLDHGQANTVFDAAQRVLEFQFGQDIGM